MRDFAYINLKSINGNGGERLSDVAGGRCNVWLTAPVFFWASSVNDWIERCDGGGGMHQSMFSVIMMSSFTAGAAGMWEHVALAAITSCRD